MTTQKHPVQLTKTQLYIVVFAAITSSISTILFWNSQTHISADASSILDDSTTVLSAYGSWFALASWILWALLILTGVIRAAQSRK